MPSPAPDPIRLAIFGDSHYAAVRQAETRGLVDLSGFEVEHWGHTGRRFRFLGYRDGAIVPDDDYTAGRFAKFNEKGRTFLPVADFDAVLFVGCRLYVTHLFVTAARARADGGFVTSALMERLITDNFANARAWEFARRFARDGTAQILFAPVSLPTDGVADVAWTDFPEATPEIEADGRQIWKRLVALAAREGITFLPQDPATMASALYTRAEFGTERAGEIHDAEHKNAAYGATVLAAALQAIAQSRRLPSE